MAEQLGLRLDASLDLLRALAPFDTAPSRDLIGRGINASETIGLGCYRCAPRLKQGQKTTARSNLEGIVSETA